MLRVLPIVLLGVGCVSVPDRPDLVDLRDDTDDTVPVVDDTEPDTDLPGSRDLDLAPFADTADSEVVLTGRWSDLDHWDFWQDLVADTSPHYLSNAPWGFDTSQRFTVYVTTDDGPVTDATVTLYNTHASATPDAAWSARTGRDGTAALFGGLFAAPTSSTWSLATVADGQVSEKHPVDALGATPHVFDLRDEAVASPSAIDVIWAVDTRAAMADLLPQVQLELPDVVVTLRTTYGDDLRMTIVTYDTDGVHAGPADEPIADGLARLSAAHAAGSGRVPLDDLLQAAANPVRWRPEARARVLVLLGASTDAGPALNERIHVAVADLAATGVRVHPLQADPDASGSFLFRNLAIATGGDWSFVLRPARDLGTDLVGDYAVATLYDNLVTTVRDAVK
ncbi:MAG: hypothetical protein H6733_13670 [Alphaproteobacteria bacterium]|nr:hypothetical protein [Alphaproteobacteria bacterium]